jgi:hypothetical protein
MPTFDFKSPDGKSYTIEGPDGATPEQAFQILQTQLGGAADPVSVNNVARSAATGVPIIGGLLNKADAATNAALAPALNGFFDPKDQLNEPTFSERYAHSLRDQEGTDAKFASQHPVIDTGAKLAGGVASILPAVAAAPGLFGATGGFASRIGAGAASNAALGGADSAIRNGDPVGGAIVGGLIGGAAPVAEAAASPFISSIMARINPTGAANRQVARAISESGRPTADIAGDVTQAANEGQGAFTLADALGNPGQRMLSTVARAPGQGRTDVVNALEQRQAGQGRRISNALAEGFNAPETAAATEARLTAARGAQADADFSAVRNDANPVNLTGAIDHIDTTISPGVHRIAGSSNIANDTVEQALQRARNLLTDENGSMLTDFAAVQRARGDIADWAQTARQGGQGNKARMLGGVLRQVDAAMENASAGHLAANRNFAQASRDIDAIGTGRDAFMRGRTEDSIPAFNALRPEAQSAFRSGFVDPAIAQTQGAAYGVNKARPLINDAFRDEAAAIAPGNDLMQRRIAREQTMFETRGHALGGSRTADNLADHEALGVNPTTVMHVATMNWHGALSSMLHAGVRGVTGNTPAVRKAVADILLQNGARLNGPALDAMVTRTIGQLQFIQQLARSGAGAAAVTTNTNQPKRLPPIFVTR